MEKAAHSDKHSDLLQITIVKAGNNSKSIINSAGPFNFCVIVVD
jgi:hypothetical protein